VRLKAAFAREAHSRPRKCREPVLKPLKRRKKKFGATIASPKNANKLKARLSSPQVLPEILPKKCAALGLQSFR